MHLVYLQHHLLHRHFSPRQMKALKELYSFFCSESSCPKCSFQTSSFCRSYRLSGKLSASEVNGENLLLGFFIVSELFLFSSLCFYIFLACFSFFPFYKMFCFFRMFSYSFFPFCLDMLLLFLKYFLRGTFNLNSHCSILKYLHVTTRI